MLTTRRNGVVPPDWDEQIEILEPIALRKMIAVRDYCLVPGEVNLPVDVEVDELNSGFDKTQRQVDELLAKHGLAEASYGRSRKRKKNSFDELLRTSA